METALITQLNRIFDQEAKEQELDSLIFSEINGFIEDAHYADAEPLITAQLNAGYRDVRLICYAWISALFQEQNATIIIDAAAYLTCLINEHTSTLLPKKLQRAAIKNAINWLQKQTIAFLRAHPVSFEPEQLEQVIMHWHSLDQALQQHFRFKPAKTSLLISNLQSLKVTEPELEVESMTDEPEAIAATPVTTSTVGSEKWQDLVKKMQQLAELANKEHYFEAALFYQDIQEKLVNFDPKSYFPEIFFPFYEQVAEHLHAILQFIDQNQSSLEWQIGEHLYQTDPDRLAENPSQMHFHKAAALQTLHQSIQPPAPVQKSGILNAPPSHPAETRLSETIEPETEDATDPLLQQW